MKKQIYLISLVIIISCTQLPPREQEISNTLNSNLHLEMFETVQKGNTIIRYSDFRKQYEYISVVYLMEGCVPCYPKFIEWHKRLENLLPPLKKYTVLFIIQGYNYESFFNSVQEMDSIKNPFYVIMDNSFKFIENNTIPSWIINRSVLIDSENKIKLIGEPFATPEMTDLFNSILGNNNVQ